MPTLRDSQVGIAVPLRGGSWIGATGPRYTWNLATGRVDVPGHIMLLRDRDRVVTELLEYESLAPLWYDRDEGLPWGPARGFGGAAHWVVVGDSIVVVGDGLSGQLRYYAATADSVRLVDVVETGLAGQPVSRVDRERLISRERRRLQAIPGNAEWLMPPLKPGITKILVDSEGFAWVRGTLDTSEWRFPTWTVFGPLGQGSTPVALPVDLDVRAIAGSRIYGFSIGPLDVPIIRVLRFERDDLRPGPPVCERAG